MVIYLFSGSYIKKKEKNGVNQSPYDLEFIHRFNLYQGAGLSIAEDNIEAIARVYGVSQDRLQAIEHRFRTNVARLAEELRESLPPRQAALPCRILAVGDSMTADREGYVNILRAYWGDHPGRALFNAGKSGETTADVLGRMPDILSRQLERAVLFIGTNDCGGPVSNSVHPEPVEGGQVSFSESARNLEYIVGNLLDAGKRVVQVTLPPADNDRMKRYFGDENWFYEPARIQRMNDFIRDQSRTCGTGLADLAAEIAARDIDPLRPDGLHLNSRGHLLLAGLLARIIS